MDTDRLQEEISVTPERTPVPRCRQIPPGGIGDRNAAGETTQQHTAHPRNGMKGGSKIEGGGGGGPIPGSRVEAAKRSLERAMNGDSGGGGGSNTKKTDDEELSAASAVKMLRDSALTTSPSSPLTSSPSPSFKSSYAKSLADSYRRASIPVVIASPKGKFYFKNDEFLSLSMRTVKRTDSSHEKSHRSLSINGDIRASPLQNPEPQSLPPVIDSHQHKKVQGNDQVMEESVPTATSSVVCERLLGKDVFVPLDQLQRVQEELGGRFAPEDWKTLTSIATNDGAKLVKLSDIKVLLRQQDQQGGTQNGHHLLVGGSEKDSQVESLRVEHAQLGLRVDQLCNTLADRDSTVQRLEEDLLRIRMECQRLMVENRSLKSSVGQGTHHTHPSGADLSPHLHQQVQLLTAQLNKAEQSRHTYEAATRQLVDFLHTVNSTLNTASHLQTNNSPTCSLHSTASTTTTKTSSTTPAEAEDDPPYTKLGRPSTPPPESAASRSTHRPNKTNAETIKKTRSVWALATHTQQPRKVSRAASTHCVASAASSCHTEPSAAGAAASPGSERTRPLTTDFLASRARELLASLKSLMRSDSVLKLNLEPKKSTSGGKNKNSKSAMVEITPIVPAADTEPSSTKPSTALQNPQSSEAEGSRRPTTLSLPGGGGGREKSTVVSNETNASLTTSQNPGDDNTNIASAPAPRIGTGKTREDTLLPQSSVVNGNPQPLSLMVVGEQACTPADNSYSSLPHLSRTLTDADQRLVWV